MGNNVSLGIAYTDQDLNGSTIQNATITGSTITGPTITGTSVAGSGVILLARSQVSVKQGNQTAKTVSATLTAAELLAGIVTVNQGAGAPSAQQLPLAADMDTALPAFAAGDAFDVSFINISTTDADDASVTTNTGWTLVGNMDFPAYSATGSLNSSGILRLRKTATGAWTAYRIA